MRHKNWLYLLFAALLVSGAAAQQPPAAGRDQKIPRNAGGPMPGRPMDAGMGEGPMEGELPGEEIELLGFGEAPGEGAVKGAPYSAKAVTERTHVLADGNRIRRTTESGVYRDAEGRFRREVTLPVGGPLAESGNPRSFIVIRDPAAGTGFVLVPERKIARKLPPAQADMRAERKQRIEEMRKKLEASGEVKTQSLGTKTIAGVAAEGKRTTRVIAAGKIGNEKPIEITNEVWYSKELQAVVLLKRNDPRTGATTYQLTNIQRQEPDPKLFQVPADYTVKEAPQGPMGRFRGRGQRRGPRGGMEGGMGDERGPRPGTDQPQPPDQDL
ncbi:MAG: hypothetical protein LAN84_10465 [Acidobacteriia bacterium]|nr:hypothetical protein [Terriglobia bacterium]